MSINGVQSTSWFIPLNASNLSEETKKKLRELGIDPSTVSSEAEAQRIISAILKKLEIQQSVNNCKTNSCPGELEVLSNAKNLAIKLGVNISSSACTNEIIEKLSAVIKAQKNEGKDINNYEAELNEIKRDYNATKESQNSFYTAMNMSANLNKLILGL